MAGVSKTSIKNWQIRFEGTPFVGYIHGEDAKPPANTYVELRLPSGAILCHTMTEMRDLLDKMLETGPCEECRLFERFREYLKH